MENENVQENNDSENVSEIQSVNEVENIEESPKSNKNKFLIGGAAVLALILGFIYVSANAGPTKEQCDRVMLTQVFFDGRIYAASIGTISGLELVTAWTTGLEDLGNAIEDLKGSAKEDGDQIFADAAGVGIALTTTSGMAQTYYNDMTTGYEDFEANYCK